MKTIRTLLSASLIFSLAISNMSFAADRNHSNDRKGNKDNHAREYRQNKHDNKHRNNKHDRHVIKHHIHKHRDNRGHAYPLGYFVGGAIVGSLLTHNAHNHQQRAVIVPSTRISFWRDSYGECFRIEEHAGRESYIAVASRFCY